MFEVWEEKPHRHMENLHIRTESVNPEHSVPIAIHRASLISLYFSLIEFPSEAPRLEHSRFLFSDPHMSVNCYYLPPPVGVRHFFVTGMEVNNLPAPVNVNQSIFTVDNTFPQGD